LFVINLMCFQEELAEGLHLIDFEQLKIENQTYNEKIEERNEVSTAPKKRSESSARKCACTWVACFWVYSWLVDHAWENGVFALIG